MRILSYGGVLWSAQSGTMVGPVNPDITIRRYEHLGFPLTYRPLCVGTIVVPTPNQVIGHWRFIFNQNLIVPKPLVYPILTLHGIAPCFSSYRTGPCHDSR